jgi:hypothetical protein
MMAEFIAGLFSGLVVGLFFGLLMVVDASLEYQIEAFDRGLMVQCVGKTGYYWECE